MHLKWDVTSVESESCISVRSHDIGTPQKGRHVNPDSEPTWLINTDLSAHMSPRNEWSLEWMATCMVLNVSGSDPTKRIRNSSNWWRSTFKQVSLSESDKAFSWSYSMWLCSTTVFQVMLNGKRKPVVSSSCIMVVSLIFTWSTKTQR